MENKPPQPIDPETLARRLEDVLSMVHQAHIDIHMIRKRLEEWEERRRARIEHERHQRRTWPVMLNTLKGLRDGRRLRGMDQVYVEQAIRTAEDEMRLRDPEFGREGR